MIEDIIKQTYPITKKERCCAMLRAKMEAKRQALRDSIQVNIKQSQGETVIQVLAEEYSKWVQSGRLPGKRLGKEDDRHLWPEMLRAIRWHGTWTTMRTLHRSIGGFRTTSRLVELR